MTGPAFSGRSGNTQIMFNMFRPLTAAIFFICIGMLAGELVLPEGTPVFDAPDPAAKPVLILPETQTFRTEGKPVRVWFRQHPIARYADYYRIVLPDRVFYASPDVRADQSAGKLLFRIVKDAPLAGRLLLPVSLGILLFLLYRLYRFPEDRKQWGYYAGITVAVRVALLSYVVCSAGNIVCNPADEPGYFEVGDDLLHGRIAGPWHYPVGHGILTMLPAILISGAKDYWALAIPLSWFGGFVLGPLALLLGFGILLKLKLPLKIAFGAVLAWALLPFFFHHVPDWEKLIFRGFFELPATGGSFRYYMELIGSGFNGMSDMGSTMLVFLTIFLALHLPPRWRYLALVSALFGISCLVRLNNVFFAPVTGFLLWEKFRARSMLKFFAVGSAAYLVIVGIQFAVNAYQFGSPWIWPYSLHALDRAVNDRPAAGFTFATLLKTANLRYLMESNLAVMSCAIAGLFLISDRRQRAVLGLWSIPVILFFCGYSHTFCDPVRFILSSFVPLIAAAALLFAEPRRRLIAGTMIAAGLILLHNGIVLASLLALILLRSVWDTVMDMKQLQKGKI